MTFQYCRCKLKLLKLARDLGVILDSQLSLSSHVAALCRAGFFHLRQLRPAVRSMTMTTAAAKTAVQAFICCRLDYCKSMLYSMLDGLLWKVQSIQNAAARLVTGARRCDHITPVLHWLPVRQRVKYKVACLVHQSLAGQTPAYIADNIQLVMDSDCHQLHSAAARTCLVPPTHNNFRNQSFNAAGLCVWNCLPPCL